MLGSIDLWGGRPDLLLLTVLVIALLRGAVPGAAFGFVGGLLFDVATFETLGVTSLLLTFAGYWTGRYGETTGRDRGHAPYVSVLALTLLYAVGGYALHEILGDPVSARVALGTALLPSLLLNLLVAIPVYLLLRRLLGRPARGQRPREVRLLG